RSIVSCSGDYDRARGRAAQSTVVDAESVSSDLVEEQILKGGDAVDDGYLNGAAAGESACDRPGIHKDGHDRVVARDDIAELVFHQDLELTQKCTDEAYHWHLLEGQLLGHGRLDRKAARRCGRQQSIAGTEGVSAARIENQIAEGG